MAKKDELPVKAFSSVAAWERWIGKNHASVRGVWVKFAKKGSGITTVTYAEAVDVALCYGWIDGQVRRLDEAYYLQRFTPRTVRSKWSKINCGKVEGLIDAGRMKASGLRHVEAAKADGRWDAAYDSPRNARVPEDLRAAFAVNEGAREFFDTLNAQNRYAILYRIQEATRPETRAQRIDQLVVMLARRETLHPR